MTTRKYPNTTALSGLFDDIPDEGDPRIPSGSGSGFLRMFSQKVINPRVKIASYSCMTLLGDKVPLDSDVIGRVPIFPIMDDQGNIIVDVDQAITNTILEAHPDLFKRLKKSIRVRSVSSCTATDEEGNPGVCMACLVAGADYTFRITLPDTPLYIDEQNINSRFFAIEQLTGDNRQTVVIYYDLEGHGHTLDLSQFVEKPAKTDSSEALITLAVPTTHDDSKDVLINKTIEVINNSLPFYRAVRRDDDILLRMNGVFDPGLMNVPYGTEDGEIEIVSARLYRDLQIGSLVNIRNRSSFRWFHRLCNSFSGSLIGLASVGEVPMPVREEVILHTVTEHDVNTAFRELSKKLGAVIPPDMLSYVDELHDRIEKSAMIVALYSIYSNVR